MSDHSLRGYLERRSTEELESMLAYYLRKENHANYEHAVLEILRILKGRRVQNATLEETCSR